METVTRRRPFSDVSSPPHVHTLRSSPTSVFPSFFPVYTFVVLGLPISLFLISKSLEQSKPPRFFEFPCCPILPSLPPFAKPLFPFLLAPSAMGPPESAELDESKNWNSASSRAGDPTFVPVPLTSHSPRPSDFGTIGSDASEEYYQPYVTRSPGMQDGTGSGKSEKGMLS